MYCSAQNARSTTQVPGQSRSDINVLYALSTGSLIDPISLGRRTYSVVTLFPSYTFRFFALWPLCHSFKSLPHSERSTLPINVYTCAFDSWCRPNTTVGARRSDSGRNDSRSWTASWLSCRTADVPNHSPYHQCDPLIRHLLGHPLGPLLPFTGHALLCAYAAGYNPRIR